MARKLLTALDQMVARTATSQMTVTRTATMLTTARTVAQTTATTIVAKETVKFLNVQALMLGMRMLAMGKLLPLLTPREARFQIGSLMMPLMEEEEMYARRKMTLRQFQELREMRPRIVRPEEIRQTLREIQLSRTAITLTDQEEFALLEKYLWINLQTETLQVLQKLYDMCTAKQWYCEEILGLEHLIKLMLQMYVYAFMEHPKVAVMLGLRVTPITMNVLRHKLASLYMTCAIQNQAVQSKPLIISAQKRKLRTKAVSGSKGKTEMVNVKQNIGTTDDLTEDTPVSVGKDATGKDMFFLALRYTYSMPFWLRRWFARQFGMPENHKYAKYFGIGCIPTRYARRSWKKGRMTEPALSMFNRDEYMKLIKKYDSRYYAGKTKKGMYGGFGVTIRDRIRRFWGR